MRRSYCERRFPAFFPDCALPLACGLKAMLLHAPIECAAAQPECFGSLADVSLEALQSFADKNRFHGLETELLEIGCLRTLQVQSEVGRLDFFAATHKYSPLHGVIEFTN